MNIKRINGIDYVLTLVNLPDGNVVVDYWEAYYYRKYNGYEFNMRYDLLNAPPLVAGDCAYYIVEMTEDKTEIWVEFFNKKAKDYEYPH